MQLTFRRNRSLGSLLTYEGLPESLKKEVLVRSVVEEDPDVLKERQDLVKNMNPGQLGNIGGLSDFPLPEKLDSMMRPSKRNLKSTKKKEETKRRWVCTIMYVRWPVHMFTCYYMYLINTQDDYWKF